MSGTLSETQALLSNTCWPTHCPPLLPISARVVVTGSLGYWENSLCPRVITRGLHPGPVYTPEHDSLFPAIFPLNRIEMNLRGNSCDSNRH